MTTVDDMLQRVLNASVSTLSQDSIEQTKEPLVQKQQNQMLHGLNEKGELIGKYRSRKYAAAKFAMNPLAGQGNVDLRLTKSFFNAQFVDVRTDTYIIESGDTKTGALVKKYGEDIFGLNTQYQQQYVQDDLDPVFINNVRNVLKL